MPELPEVETTRRGISPFINQQTIHKVVVRNRQLRWPVIPDLESCLINQKVHKVERRAKYLLFGLETGTLMIHLGMSGRLRVLDSDEHIQKHDHIDLYFNNGYVLRYTDPRRFGAYIWTDSPVETHPLIQHLGPEPLSDDFEARYLKQQLANRKVAIKTAIMNGEIVVGVGNIYANEALFMTGIHPSKAANTITLKKLEMLVDNIKLVLNKALDAGGTTLKDFRKSDGKPGYFAQELNVYGRADQPCNHCGSMIKVIKQAQRATYFCPKCQKK